MEPGEEIYCTPANKTKGVRGKGEIYSRRNMVQEALETAAPLMAARES